MSENLWVPGSGLPGHNNYEQCFVDAVDFIPSYRISETEIAFTDPVWGECTIENKGYDRIWFELLDNPLIRRLAAVEQLTLGRQLSTIPNTTMFTRWEHVWGSVAFARHMMEGSKLELDARQKIIIQLRTFFSDVGQTAFSHLGDWMFQEQGGPEDLHDRELMQLLKVGGVTDILHQYGILPEEVVFPDIGDWVETSAPDLCIDRVDYGTREMNRWQKLIVNLWYNEYPQLFKVVDDKLVMTSKEAAINFTRSFALLGTEHWVEPVHRLQLQIMQELVKRAFVGGHQVLGDSMASTPYHPRDYMYTIDEDILASMHTADPFMWVMYDIATEIGRQQRQIFTARRKNGLAEFLLGNAPLPLPGSKLNGFHGAMPQRSDRVIIEAVNRQDDVRDFGENRYTVDFYLPPLKTRLVDPLYVDEQGDIQRLSKQSRDIAQLHEDQRRIMAQPYVARVLVGSEYKGIIEHGLRENNQMWPELLEKPRMPRGAFNQLLGQAAFIGAAHRMINVKWTR